MPNPPLKILVVDDDPTVARALGRGLRRHAATIETDPERAYRRLRGGEWFDIVVSDTSMPGHGGRELLAVVRELPDPPIFVLMSGDDNVCEDLADATLHKPFAVPHLLDLISILWRRKARATTQRLERFVGHAGVAR